MPASTPKKGPCRRWLLATAIALALAGGQIPPAGAQPSPSGAAALAVVAEGSGSLVLLDEKQARVLQRWTPPGTLHGEPQFAPDGRTVYVAAREGRVVAYRSDAAQATTQVQAGERLSGLALSSDGRWLLVGLESPAAVVLYDAELREVKRWAAATRDGKRTSPVGEVLHASLRRSFVVSLRELGEVWEISYDEKAEDIYEGLVHDFRMGEGVPMRGFLNPRRTRLPEPLVEASLDADQSQLLGNASPGAAGAQAQVVNLDVRRRIASLPGVQMPRAGAAAAWTRGRSSLVLAPRSGQSAIDIVQMREIRLDGSITLTAGPALAVRTHARSPWAWIDSAGGDGRSLGLVDKSGLRLARSLDLPGRSLAPVAFSGDGCRVWVTIAEPSGMVVIHDSRTAVELARLALNRPGGVWLAPGVAAPGQDC